MSVADRVEDEIQRQIVAWWDALDCRTAHLFHVPNEGRRGRIEAAKLKGMGVRAGVADLAIMRADGRSAFAEVKSPDGRQSSEQRDFEEVCNLLGHPYRLVYDVEDFSAYIDELGVVYVEPFRALELRAKAWIQGKPPGVAALERMRLPGLVGKTLANPRP